MIKKVQKKFILTVFLILLFIFLIAFISLFSIIKISEKNKTNNILDDLMASEVKYNPGMPENSIKFNKSFVVNIYSDGYIINYDNNNYTIDDINNYINEIIDSDYNFDELNKIDKLYFKISKKSNKYVIAAVDRNNEIKTNNTHILTFSIFELIILLVLTLLTYYLSFKIVKPLKESIERQKEFISNASHELKTPLTVINSNVEVLKIDNNKKWLDNIVYQSNKMKNLINELITLSYLEEEIKFKNEDINLSDLLENEILTYDALFFESKKILEYNIDKDIIINTNLDNLKKLINIFIENALKYTNENGNIKIELKKEKDKKIELSFYNTGSLITDNDVNKIFDRFYKKESKTNSFGLGLAIAKKICDLNSYELKVENKYNESIKFIIIIK